MMQVTKINSKNWQCNWDDRREGWQLRWFVFTESKHILLKDKTEIITNGN